METLCWKEPKLETKPYRILLVLASTSGLSGPDYDKCDDWHKLNKTRTATGNCIHDPLWEENIEEKNLHCN